MPMLTAHVDEFIMFLGGLFGTFLGINLKRFGLGNNMAAADQQRLAKVLKISGPTLMVIAIVLAISTGEQRVAPMVRVELVQSPVVALDRISPQLLTQVETETDRLLTERLSSVGEAASFRSHAVKYEVNGRTVVVVRTFTNDALIQIRVMGVVGRNAATLYCVSGNVGQEPTEGGECDRVAGRTFGKFDTPLRDIGR